MYPALRASTEVTNMRKSHRWLHFCSGGIARLNLGSGYASISQGLPAELNPWIRVMPSLHMRVDSILATDYSSSSIILYKLASIQQST